MAVNRIDMVLGFKPDTQALKSEIASLQKQLSQIGSGIKPISMGVSAKDIKDASAAAQELQVHLNRATDFRTGELNMKSFQASLQSSGKTLSQYSTQLLKAGADGEKAFMALNQSLLRANMNIKKSNGLLADFATTLKNTVKWQISSSLIHGFMGSIQKATGYAKELDKSLNNIRIVTGYSTEEMAKFAKEANKAAQALSTSTTKYTDASLIYYQQGLDTKKVQERANVTVKMANVTGEAITEVSSQLTAIWNNFDDGTKHLEYYADVITALGAATASSTEEITTGLEKFAAIGETIGLSYEYATSALATVTAETRQSAEVVGTAFKTIFARIQGLSLGETLDDGTSLNKYSEALASVGINIKTQNGELKDMDRILDEMGAKWGNLNRDQQVALAQTVAGARQYNQLIALMDNWGNVMQENLETVANSGGALQEQQEIYEDSWAASSQRVQTSLQKIYDSLINEEFFKDFNNGLAKVLNVVGTLTDTLGGMQGIILAISTLMLNRFQPNVAGALDTFIGKIGIAYKGFQAFNSSVANSGGISLLTGQAMATAKVVTRKQDPDAMLRENIQTGLASNYISVSSKVQLQNEAKILDIKQQIRAISKDLTKEDENQISAAFKTLEVLSQQSGELTEQLELRRKELEILQQANTGRIAKDSLAFQQGRILDQNNDTGEVWLQADKKTQNFLNQNNLINGENSVFMNTETGVQGIHSTATGLQTIQDEILNQLQQIDGAWDSITQDMQAAKEIEVQISTIKKQINTQGGKATADQEQQLALLEQQKQKILDSANAKIQETKAGEQNKDLLKAEVTATEQVENNYRTIVKLLMDIGGKTGLGAEMMSKFRAQTNDVSTAMKKIKLNAEQIKNQEQEMVNLMGRVKERSAGFGATITQGLSTFTSVAMAIGTVSNAFKTLSDENANWTDKLMASAMALTMVGTAFNSLNKFLGLNNVLEAIGVTLAQKRVQSLGDNIRLMTAEEVAKRTGLTLDAAQLVLGQERIKHFLLEKASRDANLTLKQKEIIADKLGITTDQIDILMSELKTKGNWKEAASTAGVTTATGLETKAIWANVAATWAKLWPVLAVVAALALLVAAVKLSIDAYNADANAAKEAAEASKMAAEEFENAKTAHDNFKNSLSGYDEAVAGMAKLREGTEEYTEQLIKANEAAMELVNSRDLIYGQDYTYGDNGLIEFKEGVKEREQKESLEEMRATQSYSSFASARSKEAAAKSAMTDFNRNELAGGVDWAQAGGKAAGFAAGGAGLGAGVGALIGSFVPIAGNIVGGAVGAGVGAIVGAIAGLGAGIYTAVETWGASEEGEEKAMTLLAQEFSKVGDKALDETAIRGLLAGQVDESVIERIVDADTDKLKAVLEDINASTAAIKGSLIASSAQANRNNENYKNLSDDDKQLADIIAGTRAANATEEEKKAARKKAEGYFDGDDQDAYNEYLKARYGDEAGNYRVIHQKGKAATLQKITEDGTWENIGEDNSLENDEVLDFLQNHYLLQFGQGDDLKKLTSINTIGDSMSKSGVSYEGVNEIERQLASEEALDLSALSRDEVNALVKNLNDDTSQVLSEHREAIMEAVANYDPLEHEAYKKQKAEASLSEAATKYELDEEVLKRQAALIQDNIEGMEDNAQAAADMAIANQRMNKGVDKLTDGWKDWKKVLKGSDKTSQDYAEALVEVESAMRDILRLSDEDIIPTDFLESEENLSLLDEIANGSEEAVQQLHMNLVKAQIESKELTDDIANNLKNFFPENAGDDLGQLFNQIKSNALDAVDEIQAAFSGLNIGEGITDPTKEAEWAEALNQYALATGMTAEQMQSFLSSVGVTANVTMVEGEPVVKKIPITKITRSLPQFEKTIGPDGKEHWGFSQTETSSVIGYDEVKEPTLIPQISFNDDEPNKPTFTKISMGNIAPSVTSTVKDSGSSGGNSGSGSYKPAKRTTKNEHLESERYLDTNAALERISRNLDEISRQKDAAFGANKLKMIDKEIAALQEEAKTYEVLAAEAKEYSKTDFEKMKSMGVPIEYDKNTGEILNQDEISDYFIQKENYFTNKKADIEDKYNPNASWNQGKDEDALSEAKDKAMYEVDKEEEKWEESKRAYERYQESVKQGQEAEAQREETLAKIRELNYEKIIEKYEQLHSLYEQEDQIIEFKLSLIDDTDYTKFGEIAGLWSQRSQSLIGETGLYNDEIAELDAQLAAGEIDEADYMERINGIFDNVISHAGELQAVQEYFNDLMVNTIDGIKEDWDKQLSKFDDLNSRLEHMNTILELTGRSMDFEAKGVVLEAQLDVLADKVGAAETQFENFKDIYDDVVAQREELERQKAEGRDVDEELALAIKNEEAAYEKMIAAQEELRDAWADAAEKAREILENTYELIKKEQENTFTNGKGFDWLRSQMDTLKSMREDTLTDTNKLYETNKLIRTATLALEKTTNTLAKEKLQTFIKQTEELQKQDKLSTYELEKAQAEYALLEAELALEEARNNKSVVRLQQTSEGGYGYVYTADETNIAEAEQGVADAQNALYNLNLEAANNYYEKIFDLQEQYVTRYNEIVTNELLTEEEKMQQLQALNEDYYAQAEELQRVYNISAMALGNDLSDSWSASVETMKSQTSGFMSAVDAEAQALSQSLNGSLAMTITNSMRIDLKEFNETGEDWLERVGKAWEKYGQRIEAISGDEENSVPSRINKIKEKTGEVTEESEKLANYLDPDTQDGFVSKIKAGYESAWEATKQYFENLSSKITTALTEIEKIINAINSINETKIKPIEVEKNPEPKPKEDNPPVVLDNNTKGTEGENEKDENDNGVKDGKTGSTTPSSSTVTCEYCGKTFTGSNAENDYRTHVDNGGYSAEEQRWVCEDLYTAPADYSNTASADYSNGDILGPYDTMVTQWADGTQNTIYASQVGRQLYKYYRDGVWYSAKTGGYKVISAYDTGGYTGQWGPEGKMAVLHEKELVLNKDDTKNILEAVELAKKKGSNSKKNGDIKVTINNDIDLNGDKQKSDKPIAGFDTKNYYEKIDELQEEYNKFYDELTDKSTLTSEDMKKTSEETTDAMIESWEKVSAGSTLEMQDMLSEYEAFSKEGIERQTLDTQAVIDESIKDMREGFEEELANIMENAEENRPKLEEDLTTPYLTALAKTSEFSEGANENYDAVKKHIDDNKTAVEESLSAPYKNLAEGENDVLQQYSEAVQEHSINKVKDYAEQEGPNIEKALSEPFENALGDEEAGTGVKGFKGGAIEAIDEVEGKIGSSENAVGLYKAFTDVLAQVTHIKDVIDDIDEVADVKITVTSNVPTKSGNGDGNGDGSDVDLNATGPGNIPVGAAVFLNSNTKEGVKHGHVGIMGPNGIVYHWVGKRVKSNTLEELKNINNGHAYAWGWLGGVEPSEEERKKIVALAKAGDNPATAGRSQCQRWASGIYAKAIDNDGSRWGEPYKKYQAAGAHHAAYKWAEKTWDTPADRVKNWKDYIYATGTLGTARDGWAVTDESWIGNEITLAAGKKGQLQYLKMGSAVMPADISKNLVQWGKFTPSDVIRTIVNRLEANVFTQELLSQYALGVAGGVSNFDTSGQTVDQNVHIVAEFPNVQDRNEIELALSNLVNSASQYAFKN